MSNFRFEKCGNLERSEFTSVSFFARSFKTARHFGSVGIDMFNYNNVPWSVQSESIARFCRIQLLKLLVQLECLFNHDDVSVLYV